MDPAPNAVELTVEERVAFRRIAVRAGDRQHPGKASCPSGFRDEPGVIDRQRAELSEMGLVSDAGLINPAVAEWIKVVSLAGPT
ncbi:hypothetical protein MAHJHV47_46490 [Mycobacterium avium subsp. hominissuis]